MNLTESPRLAFLTSSGNPNGSEWHTAEWDGGYARLMLGPGAIPLAVGIWWVWITFSAGAEQPVERAGRLRVY